VDESRPDHRFSEDAAPNSVRLQTDAPALRDAAEIVRRATEDESAATDARARYRTEAPQKLEPDERIAALLDHDEWLIAIRTSALLERREPRPGEPLAAGLGGQLAVTSRRLILAGRHVLTFDLVEVEEITLSGDRLLVVMRDGIGVALDVEQPRLLRVQIAAARAAARV
jgi:hypothetical protein